MVKIKHFRHFSADLSSMLGHLYFLWILRTKGAVINRGSYSPPCGVNRTNNVLKH